MSKPIDKFLKKAFHIKVISKRTNNKRTNNLNSKYVYKIVIT